VGQRLDNPIPAPIQKGPIRLRLKQIADGLTAPNWAVPIPGATEHLYVSDQDYKLWRINLANSTKEIFLAISPPLPLGIAGDGSYDERGLLGFAFHPQYAENGLWYTYTSEIAGDSSDFSTMPAGATPNHRSVITEMRSISPSLNDPPAAIDFGRVLLTVDQPQFNHNGGALNFGPDNLLYIAFGDGGASDDEGIGHGTEGNGQNPGNPLGSLLRIDPTGNNSSNGKYGIPNDNPLVSSGTALPETYA